MSESQNLDISVFEFVQGLAKDLNADELELPGFPHVVLRLQQALADDSTEIKDIVLLVRSEPALSGKFLKISNSAAFGNPDYPVADLQVAITKLGLNLVRSTATVFAVQQLEKQEWLAPIREELLTISRDTNSVAALCSVIAKYVPGIRVDEALLAGLFHKLGRLYILTHALKRGLDLQQPEWDEVLGSWQPTIAATIVEHWGVVKRVSAALEFQDELPNGDDCCENLIARLLATSKLYNDLDKSGDLDEDELASHPSLAGVEISGELFLGLVAEHRDEIEAMQRSLC